jgi:hypothetical protein
LDYVNNTNAVNNGFPLVINSTTGSLDLGGAIRTFNVTYNNNVSGDVQINVNRGSLRAGATNAFGGGFLTVGEPGTVNVGSVNLNAFSQTLTGIGIGAGNTAPASNVITSSTAATLTLTSSTTDSTWGGVISGAVSVAKNGTSTLTYAAGATQTYTGTTTVNGGQLTLNGAHTGAGNYVINAGGKLAGGGAVTLASGNTATFNGNVSPGNSVGNLTLNTPSGSTVMAPGGSYDWEISDADTVSANGPGVRWDHLSLTSINVTATNASPATKFTVRIIALPGAGGPDLDNFNPLAPFSWAIATVTNAVTGFALDKFQIDTSQFDNNNTNHGGFYLTVVGSDLMLNYVPEPTSAMLGLIGAGAMLRRRRR